MAFKSSAYALAKLAAGNKTPLKRIASTASPTRGSQARGAREPLNVQQAKEHLAIVDAQNKQTANQCRGGSNGNAGIICNTNKIGKALPPTVLGKMHCKTRGRAQGCNGAVHC